MLIAFDMCFVLKVLKYHTIILLHIVMYYLLRSKLVLYYGF